MAIRPCWGYDNYKSFIFIPMKRLYRFPIPGMIGGVCHGLEDYFNVDPILFRVAFVLIQPIGFMAYVLLWLLAPKAM